LFAARSTAPAAFLASHDLNSVTRDTFRSKAGDRLVSIGSAIEKCSDHTLA
jgi:hypothetical protein